MIKEQIKDGYMNGQYKVKHMTHRIKEHILSSDMSYALYCHVHPGYIFYVYLIGSMLYFVLSIRVAFPHPMCHMFYIVMPIADLLGYFLHVSYVLF
jgi:hypothetical protein